MLTPGQLNVCRTAMAKSMDQYAQVLRSSPVQDAGGGVTDNWLPISTTICRAWITTNNVMDQGDGVTSVTSWWVLMPWTVDVDEEDHIVIGATTLRVIGSDAGKSDPVNQLVQCVQVA